MENEFGEDMIHFAEDGCPPDGFKSLLKERILVSAKKGAYSNSGEKRSLFSISFIYW